VSPLWTKRWPEWIAGSQATVGVAVGRSEICAVHVIHRDRRTQIQAIASVPLTDALFAGPPTPEIESALASAFSKVTANAVGKFIPCHVAVPDPVVRFSVFELDELPKSEKTRLDLIRWRFSKEHAGDNQVLDCVCQGLGQESGKHLLLGQAMDSAWLQSINRALHSAGLTPWSINMGARYRFNQFHDRFTKENHGAAMVALDSDVWSVFIWDAGVRPRLARANWRAGADDAAQSFEMIALEAERSILSYVRSGKGGTVARVYVVSQARELDGLVDALNRRLREGCVPLLSESADPDETRQSENHALAPLAFAAALA